MLVILNFNPRTREGCDPANGKAASAARRNFNPRTREGCDPFGADEPRVESPISIHAPVKGATTLASIAEKSATIFQSTHP